MSSIQHGDVTTLKESYIDALDIAGQSEEDLEDILPRHPELVEGELPNGLSYKILPNSNPVSRFEAHLEILSGSIKELEKQQGMAHLLEHIAYMGSPKRQLISGTGSRTNAYTDFHHTVFFAACPNITPDHFWKRPMLPMAFDALVDVLTTPIDQDRLDKERAAVLSEASMVNKMDYRIECQLLSTLHSENRLPKRFPIGKEAQIKAWNREDLQLYHGMHYRPDNAILYVVGDVNVSETVSLIHDKFGQLQAKVDTDKVLTESKEFLSYSMQNISRHFPPLAHQWSMSPDAIKSLALPVANTSLPTSENPIANASATSPLYNLLLPNTKVFQHDLLQSFSFHLFAKRPIEPITTKQDLKRDLMKRIILSTLQIRLNIFQRSNPLFTLADFQQINWIREGCAVCSLDITTDVFRYADAIKIALSEIKRLGLFGLTESEFIRYKMSLFNEASQQVEQALSTNSEELLSELMENTANGHTVMHPIQRFQIVEEALYSMTLEEVNSMAKEVCAHIAEIDASKNTFPRAIVTCIPAVTRSGESCRITEDDILKVVIEALNTKVEPLQDTVVPKTLLPHSFVQQKINAQPPQWGELEVLKHQQAASESNSGTIASTNENKLLRSLQIDEENVVVQRQLGNGMKINLMSNPHEPQRVQLRLYVPGGRMMESKDLPGSVLLAARTIQEGGAFLGMTREEVELFCIDHQVMVEINAAADHLTIDLASTTTSTASTTHSNMTQSDKQDAMITGSEAICQVAHIILTDFLYEKDAFLRGCLGQQESFDSMIKSLESSCLEALIYSLTSGDSRFLLPNHKQIEKLRLPTVVNSLTPLLFPQNIEMTMSGDLSITDMEALSLAYFGTVPSRVREVVFPKSFENVTATTALTEDAIPLPPSEGTTSSPQLIKSEVIVTSSIPLKVTPQGVKIRTLGKDKQLGIYLPDSEERAIGYLAGPCPGPWGQFPGGKTMSEALKSISNLTTITEKEMTRWQHPLFGYLALQILQEVANRRLFSVVREERQLTYDASFGYQSNDILSGGWYLITVTSSPETIQAAVRACKEAMQSLHGAFGVTGESVSSSKRSMLQRFQHEKISNRFWIDMLSGSQFPQFHPHKANLEAITKEYTSILSDITVQDIQALVKLFGFQEDNMTVCVGIASPECPAGMIPPRPTTTPQSLQPPLPLTEKTEQHIIRSKGTALMS